MIKALFPAEVATADAAEDVWTGALHPEEEAHVAGAGPRRRREFAAGRACARAAMTRLGVPAAPIGRGPGRAPRWPDALVGSIAHCPGYCAAAVAHRDVFAGLGLDVERAGRTRAAVLARIATPEERDRLPRDSGVDWATLLFSAKESVYKSYQPLTGVELGFRDVEVSFEPDAGVFTARLVREDAPAAAGLRSFPGRFAVTSEHVATGIALRAAADAQRS